MGLFDSLKTQFIEVIEWTETNSDRLVYRFPVAGNEIKMGAQLTVRESQVAVFINEGQLADIFEPGRFELSTANMPIMTKLKSWKYGFNSPFKAEIYFVNTKQFIDQKWGTSNPIMMRDKDFGIIRLRGFGSYAYRVNDPMVFIREILGTGAEANTDHISPQLTKQIVSSLSDMIAESKIPALDLASNYDEFSEQCQQKLVPVFAKYGLEITDLTIENLSLPKEVEEAMDKRTQMGVLGDLDQYTKFQAADAIKLAAQNEGGMAGMGAGMAVGMQMGNQMAGAMNNQAPQQQAPTTSGTPTGGAHCTNCGTALMAGAKFCAGCGQKINAANHCTNCGQELQAGAKFCAHCGQKQ